MKPLSEMTHYEILEIPPDAPPDEVDRAYRMAQATWGEDGLATYSLERCMSACTTAFVDASCFPSVIREGASSALAAER